MDINFRDALGNLVSRIPNSAFARWLKNSSAVELWLGNTEDTKVLKKIDVPEADPGNFALASNTYFISSLSRLSNSYSVSFESHKIHAGEFEVIDGVLTDRALKPIYHRLLVSKDGLRKHGNTVKVYHTSNYIPEVLVKFGPQSIRTPYVDTTALLADQNAHIINHYYTVDGVTFYRYNGVPTASLLNDYTEFQYVSGGEFWGTKPDWLIIDAGSDAYLTGVDNLNILTFTYYREIEISSVWYYDVVVVKNKAIINGNMDTAKPDLNTILLIDFNQVDNPVQADSVVNLNPIYDELLVPQVINPTLGIQFDDLGSGNYAITRTTSVVSPITSRPRIIIPINDIYQSRLFWVRSYTFVIRIRFPEHSTDGDIGFFGNQDATGATGFAFQRRFDSGSGEYRPRVRIGSGTAMAVFQTATGSGSIVRGNNYYTIGVKFTQIDNSPWTRQCKIWMKSSMAGYPLTLVLDQNITTPYFVTPFSGLPVSFDSVGEPYSSTRNNSQDYIRLSMVFEDDQKIIDEINLIDG